MKAELEQYRVQTPASIENIAFYSDDGYTFIGMMHDRGWKAIAGWGRDGYDLGSWPYVIVLFHYQQADPEKGREECYEVLYYVEHDLSLYRCPTKEIRHAVIDEIAFWHWKNNGEDWVEGYETVEQCPPELLGPYRSSRAA